MSELKTVQVELAGIDFIDTCWDDGEKKQARGVPLCWIGVTR